MSKNERRTSCWLSGKELLPVQKTCGSSLTQEDPTYSEPLSLGTTATEPVLRETTTVRRLHHSPEKSPLLTATRAVSTAMETQHSHN